MKHIKELDVRYIGKFTETQLNDWAEWFYERGELIDKLIVTRAQILMMRMFCAKPEPYGEKKIHVYSTQFNDMILEVKP